MKLTIDLESAQEAPEMRELVNDLNGLLKLRMKRRDLTAGGVIAIGKMLSVLESVSAATQPEGAGGVARAA